MQSGVVMRWNRIMRSFVIGATGIVGGYIVDRLVLAGERPQALSRAKQQSSRVDWLQGDLAHIDQVALRDIDTLYCTADICLLVHALPTMAAPSLRRIVAFTSTSIVTKKDSENANERETSTRLARGEEDLIATCERLGIAWTIIRPTIIYAEGRDGNVSQLARIIQRFGFLPLMGRGQGLRQPVHAEDLAVGAIAAAASKAASCKIYSLSGGETLSYHEMVGRIFDALGKRRRIISTPPLIWRALFKIAEPFVNANVAMGVRMSKDMLFDSSPASCDFEWSPRKFYPKFPKTF